MHRHPTLEDISITAGKARDDVVAAAMDLAGRVRSDMTDERVADGLVCLTIACGHLADCSQTLNAMIAEHLDD